MEVRANPMPDGGIVTTFTDITPSVKAAEVAVVVLLAASLSLIVTLIFVVAEYCPDICVTAFQVAE